jgi:hypothetical protein
VVRAGLTAKTEMRLSTKLGVIGVLTWALLEALGAVIALPLKSLDVAPEGADLTLHAEAAASIDLVSRAALATAIVALLYALYRRLRPEPSADIAIRSPGPSAADSRPPLGVRFEFLLVLGIVAVLFVVNLATAEIYPMTWLDEAGYSDPAINLARGNGFTSSAWYNVYWGRFWCSYPPLYPLLLAAWIRWFGVNLTLIRSFNFVAISGTAIALWHYAVRSGFFPRMPGRIAIALLPLLGYGVSFTYRAARPDTLCALLAALTLNAALLPDRRWRAVALTLAGSLMPWAGLQLAAFAVVMALLIGLWWPRQAMTYFPPLGVGIGLGVLALFGFYAVNGSLYEFFAATVGSLHTIVGEVAHLVLLHDPRGVDHLRELPSLLPAVVLQDRSTVFLSTAAILLLLALRRSTGTGAFKAAGFAVTAAFLVPTVMEIAGTYWLYYTWMGLLTVGLAVVASLEWSLPSPALVPARGLAVGCIGLALVVGLPVQLTRAYAEHAARDYDAVRAYVRDRVGPGDWVYVSDHPYFAVVERGAVGVLAQYATSRLAPGIPEDQRQRIKLLIVHPDDLEAAFERLGGSWTPSGPAFTAPQSSRLVWGEWRSYQLVAYRRE